MIKVIKYKTSYLLSNKLVIGGTLILLFLLNFNVIVQLGVLFSGGGQFNADMKYTFLFDNYIEVSRVYGMLFAILLGASTIGPDSQNGNLNIILSAYPSRSKFFLGTFITCYSYILFVFLLIEINIITLLYVFEVPFQWSDLLACGIQFPLNTLVLISVTSLGSIFMKGFKSIIVGIVAYCYYNLYMFNTIPFIDSTPMIDMTQYKDILCHLLPVTYMLGKSYTSQELLERVHLDTIFFSIECYQIIYAVSVLMIGCFLFQKKDLI